MDAANFSIKKIAFSLAFALLIPAAAFAQPAFSPTQTAITLVGQAADSDIISSTTTPITFQAQVACLINVCYIIVARILRIAHAKKKLRKTPDSTPRER